VSDHWTWVPVAEILATIKDSCDMYSVLYSGDMPEGINSRIGTDDFSDDDRTYYFRRLISYKSQDPCFGELVESILENGWTSAIGWDPERKYVGNGHHRLVAAILLCEDYIPTTVRGSIWSKSEGELGWDAEDDDDPDQIVSWSDSRNPHYMFVEA